MNKGLGSYISCKKGSFSIQTPKIQKLNVTKLKSYYVKTDFQLCLRERHHRAYTLKAKRNKEFSIF